MSESFIAQYINTNNDKNGVVITMISVKFTDKLVDNLFYNKINVKEKQS